MKSKITKILLIVGVIAVVSAFAFSLFKNIAYPLLWNDEASTAMFGRRVLEYGYPKAHDEKNYLYYFNDDAHIIGVREKGDVYIAEGWIQYYVAAIGDYFAKKTDDIYTQTALMRTPFAIAGFLGVIIFGLTISQFFKNNKKKAFIAFFLFELVSISLILHLREVRYYSLVLLFSSILFNFYIRHAIFKNLNYKYYLCGIPIFLILLFCTHYPVAVMFIVGFVLYNLFISFVDYGKNFYLFIRNFIRLNLPIFISFIFIVPIAIYFKIIPIANSVAAESSLGMSNYVNNIILSFSFFSKFEFLYLAIFLMALLTLIYIFKKDFLIKDNKIILHGLSFSILLFLIHIFIISGTVFVFERYLIVLQPILISIILLEVLLLWRISKQIFLPRLNDEKLIKKVFICTLFIIIYMNFTPQIGLIRGHLYELSHRYMGPLDFAIPYIKERYDDPSRLVIATNYEENAYMYYLRSKTTIGYVGNQLEEDKKLEPDVIVLRKYFIYGQTGYIDIFNNFFKNKEYKAVSFPVYDYPFNNIPELNFNPGHLFETKFAQDDNEKLYLFFR